MALQAQARPWVRGGFSIATNRHRKFLVSFQMKGRNAISKQVIEMSVAPYDFAVDWLSKAACVKVR